MKNCLRKLLLPLLIAVMCAACALPAVGAGEAGEGDRKYLEEGVAASKDAFFRLYDELWKIHSMDTKLTAALNRGFDAKMKSMLWGTRGLRMMMDDNQREALEMSINIFTPDYEEFVKDLEERFGAENSRLVIAFYKKVADEEIAKIEDPEAKASSRRNADEVLIAGAEALATPNVEGRGMLFPRDREKGLSGKQGKWLMLSFISPGKLLALGFVSRKVAGQAKGLMNEELFECFTKQMPAYYWEAIETDVRDLYAEVYATLLLCIDEATEFAEDPKVQEFLESSAAEGQ